MEKERLTSAAKNKETRKRKAVAKKTMEKEVEEKKVEGGKVKEKDERKCLLCASVGDGEKELAGRLLFYRWDLLLTRYRTKVPYRHLPTL